MICDVVLLYAIYVVDVMRKKVVLFVCCHFWNTCILMHHHYFSGINQTKEFGGDEVVAAKAGAGSATLSMAYAGYIFTENVLKALRGEEVTQCAFVESDLTEAEFFASPVKFGKDGVQEVLPLGELSAYEKGWFDKMMPELKKQIQKGVDFVNK